MNYDFHTEYATCCRFDNFNFNTIKSTSYDSTFRTCDIVKNVSIEVKFCSLKYFAKEFSFAA